MSKAETNRDLALRKPHLRHVQAQIAAAKARLEVAELAEERTTIRAPLPALSWMKRSRRDSLSAGSLPLPPLWLLIVSGCRLQFPYTCWSVWSFLIRKGNRAVRCRLL